MDDDWGYPKFRKPPALFSILPLSNSRDQARYMIRFLESAIDFVGAAATATGPGSGKILENLTVKYSKPIRSYSLGL